MNLKLLKFLFCSALIVFSICLFSRVSNAAPVTVAAFELNGLIGDEATVTATTNDTNVYTAILSRGSGINPSVLNNAFSSTAFVVGGTKTDAISNNEYYQFELETKSKYKLSLNYINLNLRRSPTGPNAYQWQYSLDGFATAGTDVGAEGSYTGTENAGLAMPQVVLSGIPSLQNLESGTRVTFRLYAWGSTNSSGTLGIGRLAGNDLLINGSVDLILAAGFDPNGLLGNEATFNSTTTHVRLNTSTLSRGVGINPSALANAFSATTFVVGGTKADAISNNEYFQVQIEANTGYNVSLNYIFFNLRRSATGPNAYQWQYSLDGFSTSGTDVGDEGLYTGTGTNGLAMPQINLSTVPALQGVKSGNIITLRLYAWGATNAGGTLAIGRLTGDDLDIYGSFALNNYTLTYTAGVNGSIVGVSPQTVNHGSDGSTVTASPNPGYHFVNWSDTSTANPRTDTNVTGNISVTANFAINTYTLTYTAGVNGSIVGVSPQTVNHGSDGSTVTASPNPGYHFVNWSDTSTANPRTDTNVTGNISVTANFAINTYTLTYTAGVGGSITGMSSQTVSHGNDGSAVTATPNAGYSFVDWDDGLRTSTRTDTNITGNKSVIATFQVDRQSSSSSGGGSSAVYSPPGSGTGSTDRIIPMDETRDVRNIETDGINILGYIGSKAVFETIESKSFINGKHSITITNVDLFNNIVVIRVESTPQIISLKLKELAYVDLDDDLVPDISIQFNSIYVNRVELTTKSIVTKKTGVATTNQEITQTTSNLQASCKLIFTRDIKSGATGDDVKELQKYLNSKGFIITEKGPGAPGNETTKFGRLTYNALIKFQKANNISPISGVLDSTTKKYIKCSDDKQTETAPKQSTSIKFTRDLKPGMTGDDVKELQKYLNTNSFIITDKGPGAPGNETTKFGRLTYNALIKFQKANNITPANGYLDSTTRELLNK